MTITRIGRGAAALGAAAALLTWAAVPAGAADASALDFVDTAIEVHAPSPDDEPCDGVHAPTCGQVEVSGTLTGMSAFPPTGSAGYFQPGGTVMVGLLYGCQAPSGQHLRQYDRLVWSWVSLYANNRNMPITMGGGDSMEIHLYANLLDEHPRNCPAGTTAMQYGLAAGYATVWVGYQSPPARLPDASTGVDGFDSWFGAVEMTPTWW